jgi:hypothetical protein
VSKKTDSVRSLNRRAEKRHRPEDLVLVTVYTPDLQGHAAYVKDLSAEGVGLYLIGSPPAPGTRLRIRFPGPGGRTMYTVLAEVVHSGRQEGGYHLVGCKFLSRPDPSLLHESLRAGD